MLKIWNKYINFTLYWDNFTVTLTKSFLAFFCWNMKWSYFLWNFLKYSAKFASSKSITETREKDVKYVKVNNKDTRMTSFEHNLYLFLVFLLSTLSMHLIARYSTIFVKYHILQLADNYFLVKMSLIYLQFILIFCNILWLKLSLPL